MSRTYRNNLRFLNHIGGNIVSCYNNVSMSVPKIEDVIGCSYDISATRIPKIVKVGDVDCYGSGVGSRMKALLHQIDRSRQKLALYRHIHNENKCHNDWVPSYDPWDYD